MNPLARFGLLLLLGFLSGCASTSHYGPANLRYDGIYVGGDYPYGCVHTNTYSAMYPERWDFLRFFPDGTVIEDVGTLFITPAKTQKCMAKDNKWADRRGTYTIDGNRISMTTTVPKRAGNQTVAADPIRSSGTIDGGNLHLKRRKSTPDPEWPWYKNFAGAVDYRFYAYR